MRNLAIVKKKKLLRKKENRNSTYTSLSKQNLICNFRAPDEKHFKIWQDFKKATKEHGLDVCYVSLNLFEAWLKSLENPKVPFSVENGKQTVIVYQKNFFDYNVSKPRRENLNFNCSRNGLNGTVRSLCIQAYIMEKARDLQRSFSFADFPELSHNSFRKSILELKKRKKIVPLKPRTNPQFYILTEWEQRYLK